VPRSLVMQIGALPPSMVYDTQVAVKAKDVQELEGKQALSLIESAMLPVPEEPPTEIPPPGSLLNIHA
jgi:hypothetical protein